MPAEFPPTGGKQHHGKYHFNELLVKDFDVDVGVVEYHHKDVADIISALSWR